MSKFPTYHTSKLWLRAGWRIKEHLEHGKAECTEEIL